MIGFALPTCGFLTLDKDQNPVYSVTNIGDGMPVFSPTVVMSALDRAYAAGVAVAIQYHADKAAEHLEAKNYFLAKIHADAADGIKAAADAK